MFSPLLSIIIFFAIVSSGCIEKYPPTTDTGENKPNVTVIAINTSKENHTLANCDNMTFVVERDKCYLTLPNKNLSICEKIRDNVIKNICYTSVAESEKNISICEKMVNCSKFQREICYYMVASAKRDISICDYKIVDKTIKDRCYLSIVISGNYTKRDISICDYKIVDKTIKDRCYLNIAISENDSSICNKINNESRRGECYQTLLGQL